MLFFSTVLFKVKAPVIAYDKSVHPTCTECVHVASAM